jgi:ABC-2 type transport system permease protein
MSLNNLRWELRKLFARRRAWGGLVAIIAFELVFIMLLQHPDARFAAHRFFERIGYSYPDNFTGLTIAHFLLGHTLALPGALFIALTTSDILAKEDEDGLLRMILCRPISRWSVLLAKFLACIAYAILVVLLSGLLSLALGLAFEGRGQMLVFNPDVRIQATYAFEDGLLLYLWALGFLIPSNFTVVSLAFGFSAAGWRSATATAATIFILAADDLLRHMAFFASFRSWFITTRIQAWLRVYLPGSDWSWVAENYGPLLTFDALVVIVGAMVFVRRDFKP